MKWAALKKKLKDSSRFINTYHWFLCKILVRPRLKLQFNSGLDLGLGQPNKKGKKILVSMVETSHYQFLHVLGVAKALQLRGHEIKVLLCDESLPGCELKSVYTESKKDVCWNCRFNRRELVPLLGLETISYGEILSEVEMDEIKEISQKYVSSQDDSFLVGGVDIHQCIKDSVVRYFYGAVPSDPEVVRSLTLLHTQTALINIKSSQSLDESWHPDVVFTNMTAYSTWYPIFAYYQDRIKTISMSDFNFFGVTFNFHEYFQSNKRYLDYKEKRKDKYLYESEKIKLEAFFSERVMGRDKLFLRDNCFSDDPESSQLMETLELDQTKRNLFLFSNLYWDIGLSEPGSLYEGVVEWVLDTISLVKNNKDIRLYIKTHPAELYGPAQSRKGIPEIIRETYTDKELTNIFIIGPELKIKPYVLFPYIDCAVLFQGTLGFELLYSEVPVISCSRAVYSGFDFLHEPKGRAEYSRMLEKAGEKSFDRKEFELLAYFYFIKAIVPWKISEKVYASNLENAFNIESLQGLMPGSDPYLDHLCECVLGTESVVPEHWSDINDEVRVLSLT